MDVRWQDKNEVGLAAHAAMLRARCGASILHCDHGALCKECALIAQFVLTISMT